MRIVREFGERLSFALRVHLHSMQLLEELNEFYSRYKTKKRVKLCMFESEACRLTQNDREKL
jgi:hypothetical protein